MFLLVFSPVFYAFLLVFFLRGQLQFSSNYVIIDLAIKYKSIEPPIINLLYL